MQTVVETPTFIGQAAKQGMRDAERDALITDLAKNPERGDPIMGSGGCRKVRVGGKGKGKSGGFRVITFYSGENIPLFLLTVYAKGNLGNLTKAETNVLKALTKKLLEEYEKK